MSEQVIFNLATPVVALEEGDVCLLIKTGENGSVIIHHNIPSVEEHGELSAERGDAAGLIMALTMNELLENDEPAFLAAMTRVVTRMQGTSIRTV